MAIIRKPVFILFVVLASATLLSLSGCVQQMGTGNRMYVDDYKAHMTKTAAYDSEAGADCKIGKCWCMVCMNSTTFPLWPMTSMLGQRCYMEKDCKLDTFLDLRNKSKTKDRDVKQFMIGQGPSFSDFAQSKPFCSNASDMAVQWLVGGNKTTYTLPGADRAECMIQKSIIPVYVLYSKGLNINATRAGQIANVLATGGRDYLGLLPVKEHVGPVIIVTEIDFNKSDASLVADEVKAINDKCNPKRKDGEVYCWVAVAPKFNDTAALDAVMQIAGPENVDLVAYGINGKYALSCDGSLIRQQALSFSSYALYHWDKPSIIPYIMFDNTGSNIDNTCDWNEQELVSAYGAMLSGGARDWVARGAIGMAPYMYSTSQPGVANPLGCTDCALNKTAERMRAWFGWCQKYTWYDNGATQHQSMRDLIVFSNGTGGSCLFAEQGDYMASMSWQDTMRNKDILNALTPPLASAGNELFSCDECLIKNDTLLTKPPFGLDVTLANFKSKNGAAPSKDICEKYPEIDRWASNRNLDPTLVRAFIYTESNFERCAAARVCSSECYNTNACSADEKAQCLHAVTGGGYDECYPAGYDDIYDPVKDTSQTCTQYTRSGMTIDLKNAPLPDPDSGKTPLWRWCGLGIMQSIEPPYTFWPDSYLSDSDKGKNAYKDIFQRSGLWKKAVDAQNKDPDKEILQLVYARGCDEEYNPFDPSDSICMGTLKMEQMIAYGHAWISKNGDDVGVKEGTPEADIFAAYIAGNMYGGYWLADNTRNQQWALNLDNFICPSGMSNAECWRRGFIESKRITPQWCKDNAKTDEAKKKCKGGEPWKDPDAGKCYGYTDFVTYVRECWPTGRGMYNIDGGANKIAAYYWLLNSCDTFCPADKKLATGLQRPITPATTPNKP